LKTIYKKYKLPLEASVTGAAAGAADPLLLRKVFKSTELKYLAKNSG